MWVRTTLTIERWTKEKAKDNTSAWDENSTGKEGAGQEFGGGFRAGGVAHKESVELQRAWRRRRDQRPGWVELGPGGGLTPRRGPMIEDWGAEALGNACGSGCACLAGAGAANTGSIGWKALPCRSRAPAAA